MSILSDLRSLVLLRRIAIAHERSAAALESIALSLRTHWKINARPRPSPTQFASFDIDEANKRWAEEQEAAAVGQTPEDRSR